jgi:small subunit ribosomal protein S6
MAELKSLRDQPGTQREYETIFILRADTANESIAQVNARLKGVIESMQGKILKCDNWGKRKLAYEIRKQLKGIYLYWQYLATAGTVAELERNLRMLDSVVRFYTVKVDQDIDAGARPTDVSDETWSKAATTAADEEEIMTGQARSPFADDDDDDIDADAEEAAIASGTEEAPAAPAEAKDKE